MKVSRAARIALLLLAAFLFQTDKFMALAATPPPSACLCALDSSADRAFQIAGVQAVRASLGVVDDSRVCDDLETGGTNTMPAIYTPINAIGHNTVEAKRRFDDEQVEAVHHMGNSTAIAYGMALGST
jgi:hypothetical protein